MGMGAAHRRLDYHPAVAMTRPAILAAAAVALGTLTATARLSLEEEAGRIGRIRDPAWLPSGKALRLVSFSQRLLLADWYWLKTVMYVGEGALAPHRGWEALYPLAEIVTDLDPRFSYAYQVAGSNLSGLAHRYAEADLILEKGMRNLPGRWSLPFVYAVNKFLYEGDYVTAAEYARRAAAVGRRPYLLLLAANLSLVVDSRSEYAAAASVLEESIRQAANPELKQALEQRLVRVRTYQALSDIESAVREFMERYVRRPFALEELQREGLLARIPPDPSGGTFVYSPLDGTVRSSILGERRPFRVNPE